MRSTDRDLVFRVATADDLEAIVELLFDDVLGAQRERLTSPLPRSYRDAFGAIDADPNNELLVACLGQEVVGTLQLTYTPSLSFEGGWRATVESVRIAQSLRGHGVGSAFMKWTIDRARSRGCRLVQLTTNKARVDAVRFYERLGFQASHVGMKIDLRTDS